MRGSVPNFSGWVEKCQRQGWWAYCEPIQVGCRGSLKKSSHSLELLGLQKEKPSGPSQSLPKETLDGFKMHDLWSDAAGMKSVV